MDHFKIIDLTTEGLGLAKQDRKVYFIEGGILGETCSARLVERKKSYDLMEKTATIEPSPYLVEAVCPHFGTCDGCSLQNIHRDQEALLKKRRILESINRLAGENLEDVDFFTGQPYYYRNKLALQVQDSKIGYFNRKSRTFLEIKTCPLAEKAIDDQLMVFKDLVAAYGSGLQRLEIRTNKKDLQVGLVGRPRPELIQALQELPAVLEISVQRGRFYEKVYGDQPFVSTIGDQAYQMDQSSFFQVNRAMAQVLYDLAKDQLKGESKLLDLYSGIGAIGLYLGQDLDLTGVEINPRAVENARENARRNGHPRARFLAQPAEDYLIQDQDLTSLVVDPPRKGLDKKLIKSLAASSVKKIVYISCNPASLARDIKRLKEGGFGLDQVQGVDLFPQTLHVEALAVLTRG